MTSSLAESPDRGRQSGEHTTRPSASSTAQKASRFRSSTPGLGALGRKHDDEDDDADLNEDSPLLSPAGSNGGFPFGRDNDHNGRVEEEDEFETTKSVWYLLLLTISIGGLQIAWSVELSNGSPYLISLGLSKSLMALVWIAGPLSGTLVQPYVGMLSDRCRIRWGKRKPFMLGGTLATVVSLLLLSWTKELVGGFLGLFGADHESDGVKIAIVSVAVLWVYVLDFAINTVQAAIRAFIVDCAPSHQQEAANAMASRIVGFGNIFGYVAGYINLPKIVPFLGDTQFKDLCAVASIGLTSTVLLSCLTIKERDPRLEGPPPKNQPGVLSFFGTIFTSIKRLPPQIKKVCLVQFSAWIGFFPMLFYTSSYIGEIYAEPFLEENPNMTPEELDHLYEKATRVGTFALLIFSITSLATNVLLPFFIAPTYDSQPNSEEPGAGPALLKDFKLERKTWLDYLIIPGLTLRRAWMLSLILFTGAMFCTVFVRTVEAATALIGLVGITWALTLWAPWAIISAEISKRDAEIRSRRRASGHPQDAIDGQSEEEDEEEEEVDQAGVILGIHNMAIAAPQIIATVVSSLIFRAFQKPRGTPGDHSIAIVLALGGITVLVAAYFVHLIKDEAPLQSDEVAQMEEAQVLVPSGRRPSLSASRRQSFEQRSRKSLDRATLVRSNSFGGGLEY